MLWSEINDEKPWWRRLEPKLGSNTFLDFDVIFEVLSSMIFLGQAAYIFKTQEVKSLRWCLFFGWIEKAKIFYFFYSVKSNLMTSSNIMKVNLLSIDSV